MSVETINADAVLARMRALASQASSGIETRPPRESAATDFGQLLKGALDAVNETQQSARGMTESFERGEAGVELADVMIAIQKASISFQAATQVRNRLVSAYQDIMNMPL
ncbi:MAG: flagellar hook-basal body complex protein FliE [Gammaproteobacteria bacterium]